MSKISGYRETLQHAHLSPASRSKTRIFGFSDNREASTHPAAPANGNIQSAVKHTPTGSHGLTSAHNHDIVLLLIAAPFTGREATCDTPVVSNLFPVSGCGRGLQHGD